MKKFGKNKVYLDNLLGFKQDYKKESKISKLRNRFNNVVREKGNNLYNGLGDLLTTEVSERGRKEVMFLGVALSAVFVYFFGGDVIHNKIQNEILKPKVVYNNALLVQQKFKREDDIDLMRTGLTKRNFNVEIIEPKDVTKENLFYKLDDLAKNSNDKSVTLLYFANHGGIKSGIQGISLNKDFECVNEGDDFVILPPSEFYKKVLSIKGKKALIIDTCFSGVFTDYLKKVIKPTNFIEWKFNNEIYGQSFENLKNYLVIASCPELTVSKLSDKYIEGKEISGLMNGLYSLLSSEKGKINLSEANILCGNDFERFNIDNINEARMLLGKEYPLSYEMQRIFDINFILPKPVTNK